MISRLLKTKHPDTEFHGRNSESNQRRESGAAGPG
jgi:hypothetical protein